jgi:NADPH:quinone reductase-like Zn-dependent oxidoreductase
VLGYDLVGEVVKVDPGVHEVSIGQRVADLTTISSYAQFWTLEADRGTIVDAALDVGEATPFGVELDDRLPAYAPRRGGIQRSQKLLLIGFSAVGPHRKMGGCGGTRSGG